jgi:hypothetical protein
MVELGRILPYIASIVPLMKAQLRLMIVAALLLVSIAASCQNQSIAGERRVQAPAKP